MSGTDALRRAFWKTWDAIIVVPVAVAIAAVPVLCVILGIMLLFGVYPTVPPEAYQFICGGLLIWGGLLFGRELTRKDG